MLAAVGLLSRSAASAGRVCFLAGGGGASWALRALASEAAVGANRPEPGVFGREVEEGVFGLVNDGVFARAGVAGGRTDALDEGRGAAGAPLTFFKLLDARSTWAGGVDADAEIGGGLWNAVGGDLAGVRAVFAEVVAVDRRPLAALALDGVAGVRALAADPVLD